MNQPPPLDVADRAIDLSADTMAHDFLAALLAELRQMPDHWMRLNEQLQQKIIERLKEKIRAGTEKAVTFFMHGEFPAVPAELKAVAIGSHITASLSVQRDALYRHALSDAQGQKVLVIITNVDRWTARMDEIKARADQLDLWDQDYDPAKDQPAYRRDQDRTMTGPSWADLKKSLGVGEQPGPTTEDPKTDTPAEGATPVPTNEDAKEEAPPEGPAQVVDSDLTAEEESVVKLRMLQEQLTLIGIGISLGALKERTEDELDAARVYVQAWNATENGQFVSVEKPAWLPPFDGQGAAQ